MPENDRALLFYCTGQAVGGVPTYQRSAAATNLDPAPRPGPFLEQGMGKGPSESASTEAAAGLSAASRSVC